MTQPMSREERKAAYMEHAAELFEEMEDWYDKKPEATFEEIEQQARISRRKLMGASLAVFVNGRETGKREEGIACEKCQTKMTFKGHKQKEVYGIEGDTTLKRAYYHCKECAGGGFFPSG